MDLGRKLIVRQIARALRGGISEATAIDILARRFRYRDAAWRWEIIGDAKIRNGERQVRDDYRAWRAGQ